ncbi:FliG C-terminal domain-containing protein [Roseiconus lacunae]|uniref:FliG C-terminal domain-containing protein n=1 Tax=Roseiconus lacunae TaxID=2605694 RepID=A0ABT7PDD8_9BACT|nr:FliG C-terminal domain-containing protein [Roseiconus lacunae]MDM4014515.1 FliG C-terminal domain-containing protein [Roseiconus lacunae]WRQ49828.1 FliG C-terminal domain-containing protein [Stieleria sp. HD01]
MKTMLTRQERLALLLYLMGDEATQMAREGIPASARAEVDQALEDFREYPPEQDEIDLVVEDFENYFRMALQNQPQAADGEDDDEDGPRIFQIAEETFDVELEPIKKFEKPRLTGDVIRDLNQMHPYQVAHALKDEHPTAAAIVLRKLANEHAAKTLEFLPELIRPKVFLELARPSKVTLMIQQRIFAKTLELALSVEEREIEVESSQKMANMMRSLPRSLRGPMLDELQKRDKALSESVRNLLYRFDDLNRLSDRDMQKLLGQCQTDQLVLALQDVEPELLEKVLSNMSKRAKEALQEEIEFKANAPAEEIEEARSAVAKTLGTLCEAGEVSID